jgi:hypothetical protein
MAKGKNIASVNERERKALNESSNALDRFFNELFKDVDTTKDMGRLHEVFDLFVAEQELSAEESESLKAALRLYVARNFARDILRHWPLTAEGRLEQNRELQKRRIKLVCKAFASSEPETIFKYDRLPRELDPKLIRSNLDAFVEWAMSEPADAARKSNKVRDETIALMVSTILMNTNLRPTRNRATRGGGGSACSIVVDILGEQGINVSEDLVENAWKTHAKDFGAAHAYARPDLVRDLKPTPSEK